MMISDRHIHDNEYINVINVIKELSIWPPSDNEIKELVKTDLEYVLKNVQLLISQCLYSFLVVAQVTSISFR